LTLNILTRTTFSVIIEKLVCEKKISYMDAIVHYCENNELEVESAAKLINTIIKSKIECEAQELNFLPKTAKLPL
jgi:uncharacterized protein YllA (UPF0747 family)